MLGEVKNIEHDPRVTEIVRGVILKSGTTTLSKLSTICFVSRIEIMRSIKALKKSGLNIAKSYISNATNGVTTRRDVRYVIPEILYEGLEERIIDVLSRERARVTELAEMVGVSPKELKVVLRSMEKEGLIKRDDYIFSAVERAEIRKSS